MGRKPKFIPVINRVKLNPEQAVLACPCYVSGVDVLTSSASRSKTQVNGCDYLGNPRSLLSLVWKCQATTGGCGSNTATYGANVASS